MAQSKIRRLKQQSKSLSKQQTAILKREKEEGAKVSRSPEAPDRVKVGLRVKMVFLVN